MAASFASFWKPGTLIISTSFQLSCRHRSPPLGCVVTTVCVGEAAPGIGLALAAERLDAGQAEHDVIVNNPRAALSYSQQRARLPVFKVRSLA